MSKTLYVQNLTGFDLNIADLAIRIKAGTTIEVYAFNPYLTEEAINKSLTSGYLYKGSNPDKDGRIHCQILKKPKKLPKTKIKVAVIEKTPIENAAILVNPIEHIEDGGFLSVDYGFDTSMSKTLPTNLPQEEITKVKSLADFFNTGAKVLQNQIEDKDLVSSKEVAKTQKVLPKVVEVDGIKSIIMEIDEDQTAKDTIEQVERPKIKTSKKTEV